MLRRILPISVLRIADKTITKFVVFRDKAKDRVHLPKFKLTEKHIGDCQLLPDREAFLKCLPKRAVIGEIGVDVGNFTEQILEITNPSKLHLIDNWNPYTKRYKDGYYTVAEKFKVEIEKNLVEINRGLSVNVLKNFNDNYFDWVYIDTVHDYETTAEELKLAKLKVKKGGIISGHDYTTRENINGIKYGVIEAVHEFCVQNNWKMIYLTIECSGHNTFAIQQMS